MATIVFMRHGQARNNVERRLVGRLPNVPLTEDGVKQAQYAAHCIKEMNISRIYASPMQRAMESAQIVAQHNSIPVTQDMRLAEVEVGKLAGGTYDEITSVWGNVTLRFYQNDSMLKKIGIETFKDVKKRVQDMVRFVLEEHKDENVLLVTHMDPIKAMFATVLDLSPEDIYGVVITTGSINVFSEYQGRFSLGAVNVVKPDRLTSDWINIFQKIQKIQTVDATKSNQPMA